MEGNWDMEDSCSIISWTLVHAPHNTPNCIMWLDLWNIVTSLWKIYGLVINFHRFSIEMYEDDF